MNATLQQIPLWPFGFYAFLTLALVAGILIVSYYLGEKHNEGDTGKLYESGVPPTKPHGTSIAAKYYIVALFFIVFDIEAAFLFGWASAARELGWQGYFGVLVFIAVLSVALIYEWRLGILDFGSKRRPS